MKDNFDFKDDSRVIAQFKDIYMVTNSNQEKPISIREKGVLISKNLKVLTKEMPIGVFIKWYGPWENVDYSYEDLINKLITKNSLLGFAVGDAIGVPVEFMKREEVRKLNMNDMMGNGTHRVPAGSWSDDTSMIIATMDAIINSKGDLNYELIMENYLKWLNESKFTSTDFTFGVGGIIYDSLCRYIQGASALEAGGKAFMDNGNGSLMRILPFALYCIINKYNNEETYEIISKGSQLTHANDISKMSCYIYTEFLREIIISKDKQKAFNYILNLPYEGKFSNEAILAHSRILNKSFLNIKDYEIKESGYVVDTLESVLYSILNTNNYKEAVLEAVNLGYDTDTVAGITGSIAVLIYGIDDIPKTWLDKLKKTKYLEEIADNYSNVIKNKITEETKTISNNIKSM